MRLSLLAGLVAGLALSASPPVSAQDLPDRSPREGVADLRLATAVQLALVDDPRTRPLEVQVGARDGVVAVVGIENAAFQRIATQVARGVPGVRALQGLGAPTDGAEVVPVPIPALPEVHVVRRGDTLYGIARRYSTTLDALVELNGLRSTSIRVGQRIRVR